MSNNSRSIDIELKFPSGNRCNYQAGWKKTHSDSESTQPERYACRHLGMAILYITFLLFTYLNIFFHFSCLFTIMPHTKLNTPQNVVVP